MLRRVSYAFWSHGRIAKELFFTLEIEGKQFLKLMDQVSQGVVWQCRDFSHQICSEIKTELWGDSVLRMDREGNYVDASK